MSFAERLRIRPAGNGDWSFVEDAWRRSYEGAAAVRGADREHYQNEMRVAVRRLLDNATTLVACDPADEDTLVGFCSFTDSELHYVYVKRDFRGQGVARKLLTGIPIHSYTFLAPNARPRKGWRFTPRFTL